jgi:hypothetical protein
MSEESIEKLLEFIDKRYTWHNKAEAMAESTEDKLYHLGSISSLVDVREFVYKELLPSILDQEKTVVSEEDKKKLVFELRNLTGRGLFDCKKALEATDFSLPAAEYYLSLNNSLTI